MSSSALLLRPEGVDRVREALEGEGVDGWLLYEFHGRNPVAARLLGLEWTTRRSFTLVPRRGDPVALIHTIEHSSWRDWPWDIVDYSGWRELSERLSDLVEGRGRLAAEISPGGRVPTLDLLPWGTVESLRDLGVELVSSGDLVTAFHAVWTPAQLEGHRRSARALAEVAREAFARAAESIRDGAPLREGELASWIRAALERRDVGVEQDCLVASGPGAADPHYRPGPGGEPVEPGRLLLIDLWGRGREDGVFADQTWMAYLGTSLPDRAAEVWEGVRDARDAALDLLRERHAAGAEVRGFEVDRAARGLLEERGMAERFVHRTGHSIDTELHGSGPNLDDLETRDDRRLLPGVGFSVEPGVYVPGEIGVRSEVNVHWGAEGPEVTPPEPQERVFLLDVG